MALLFARILCGNKAISGPSRDGILKFSDFSCELWAGKINYLQVYLPQCLEKHISTCFCATSSLSASITWNGIMTSDGNSGENRLVMQCLLQSWICLSQCLSPICFIEGDISTSCLAGQAAVLESLL